MCCAAGMLVAVFTNRVFLMKHERRLTGYLDFHWDVDLSKYAALYNSACGCRVDLNRLTNPDLGFCAESTTVADLLVFSSHDYDVPLLEVNPGLRSTFQKLFPDGNIYHAVATRLFSFSQRVQRTAARYDPLADACLVGVQLRYRKGDAGRVPIANVTMQFAAVATAVAGSDPGTVFIAADVPQHRRMAELLPGRRVWWSKESQATIGMSRAAGGNPGTDLSAFVDLYLLTRCKHLVCTPSSSFGAVAAAYDNITPVNAIIGPHGAAFYQPIFWKALNAEPQMYKAGRCCQEQLTRENLELPAAHHTYWLQMQQWHW
jgi:hypothetical protein